VTPASELDRLFGQVLQSIPKPAPLDGPRAVWVSNPSINNGRAEALDISIDPIDADEAVHGVCAQGESDDQ
jgi:hypothetical protein